MGRSATTDHIAFVTGDTRKTYDFYTRVLRWPLVGTHRGTEPDGRAFFMTAFAADGYCIEFEEIEGRPAPPTSAMGFPHFGLDLGSAAAYEEWKAHLEQLAVEYLEVAPGDLFITDPNGVSFQLFVKHDAESDETDRATRAKASVDEWIAERGAATTQRVLTNDPSLGQG
jgi:catechol 2,3-dioxygenase-like lactoylglutathione lyase family enzyme